MTTNVIQRGISYARKINGVEVRGSCVRITFESHAKIIDFKLNWRNFTPFEARLVATPDEIIDFIKSEQACLPMQSYDSSDIRKARKLTVVEITPIYFDNGGMKPLDFMFPYADLKVIADLGNTNTATFFLNCPILSTNVFSMK